MMRWPPAYHRVLLTCTALLQCEYLVEKGGGGDHTPQSRALEQGKAFTSAERPSPSCVAVLHRSPDKNLLQQPPETGFQTYRRISKGARGHPNRFGALEPKM